VVPVLTTERLILRGFREDDLEAYTEVLRAPPVRRSLRLPDDVGREQAWLSMVQMMGQWALRNTGNWALEERATGVFIGRAGSYFPERAGWPGIEIGWTLHPRYWGKGYATEAGRAARDWVFANHDVDALYSCILHDNVASQAVAARLGLVHWADRTFPWFPDAPHGIWRLRRADYDAVT
jgi:RimJ/RimL family protein N-acetyltransferase